MTAECRLCPRECRADRAKAVGFCGCGVGLRVAKAALHLWEEPCLTGQKGAGAVFFSGCNLRCVFCQNRPISRENYGKDISAGRLAEIFAELEAQGAACLDLVTATPYADVVADVLRATKPQRHIPVVWNTGGYESLDTLRLLDGLVDIYMPDLKFMSPELSQKYCAAPDYFARASEALSEMYRQTGAVRYAADGTLARGVLVRHLVMPAAYRDSLALLRWLAGAVPPQDILLSVMSQYTPMSCAPYKELTRPISSYEYNKVADLASELGFVGYTQERASAVPEYTPDFDLQGV